MLNDHEEMSFRDPKGQIDLIYEENPRGGPWIVFNRSGELSAIWIDKESFMVIYGLHGSHKYVKPSKFSAEFCKNDNFVYLMSLQNSCNFHLTADNLWQIAEWTGWWPNSSPTVNNQSEVNYWKKMGYCSQCGDEGEVRPGPTWWCRNNHGMIF
jgi:hypothetical protein